MNGELLEADPISTLTAIEQIKQLKAAYFRSVDTKDMKLLRSLFTGDVTLDARGATTDPVSGINASPGVSGRVLCGIDEVMDAMSAGLRGVQSIHQGCMPEIQLLSKTSANGVWSMFDKLLFPTGPVAHLTGFGHYHETYEQIDRKWRIKSIRITRLRIEIITRL